ncbi:MAG: hypothetical protein KME12_03130 [Trichocoleus desertorum ATA4-8-CV12]|jgi:hypothetical protein|nr:hypothetical protein [Trichocoleus desertorum ATA4-8-CV12]
MQKKKLILWVCGGCIGFVSLPVLWILGGNWVAHQQENQSQQQWQALNAQFDHAGANQSALQLEALSAGLGINLLGVKSDRPLLSQAETKQAESIHQELQAFLERQLEDNTDAIEPIPQRLQNYLKVHATQLEAIRQQGLQGEMPQWESATPYPDVTQVRPTFAGFVKLQRLLIADVLEKHRLGQTEAAIASLEASWKLNQALRDRPELMSQTVALIVTKTQAGTLRKMDRLPPVWQQRLMEHDYRQSFQTALNWESWLVADVIRKTDLQTQPESLSGVSRFWYSLRQPYLRLAALDAASKMRQAYRSLPQENTCLFDAPTFDMDLDTSLATWNGERGVILFGFAQQWRTAGFLMIDLELTQKVLKTKAAIAQPQTEPQPQLKPVNSTHRPSVVCPHAGWIYRNLPDQGWSLTFSQTLERPAQEVKGLVLPLTYRAKAQKL